MKVLISNPPWPGEGFGVRSDVRWPHRRKDKYVEYPIYLSYLVSVLKQAGFETVFLDGIINELSISQFAKQVQALQPDIAVLECSTPSFRYDLETASALKTLNPDLFVVLLGAHATYFHRNILHENTFIDAICRGEFEYTVRDLCLKIQQGVQLEDVFGLSFRRGKQIIINPDRPLIDNLDSLPFPDRKLVSIDNYRTANYRKGKSTCMITTRGCPFQCIFCLWPGMLYGKKYRQRSPENVVEEIDELTKKHNVREIYFDDDCFTLNRDRVLQICSLVRQRRITVQWICQCRVDQIDRELLQSMKTAGCHYIYFGIESGNEQILKSTQKGITLEQAKNAIKLCRTVGITTQIFFLLGLPGETQKSIEETIQFAKDLNADSAQFAIAVPHPGTKLYDICVKNNWLRARAWDDYSGQKAIIETNSLTAQQIETARLRAYKKFYLRPGFILKTLLRLKNPEEIPKIITGTKSIVNRLSFYREVS